MSDESQLGRDQIDLEHDYVDLEQDCEVREWSQSHGATEDEVRDAVKEIQSFMAVLEVLVDHSTTANTAAT